MRSHIHDIDSSPEQRPIGSAIVWASLAIAALTGALVLTPNALTARAVDEASQSVSTELPREAQAADMDPTPLTPGHTAAPVDAYSQRTRLLTARRTATLGASPSP